MIAAPRARDRVAGLPPRAAPSCVRQFSGSRGPARLQAVGWGREEGLLLCVPPRPPASPRGSRRMPRGARRPGSQLAEAGGERSGNGPSSPCEELASEARRLPGTRGGGGPPHQLARRVPGPVVMEKERGSQWACARDPPRKQTEPSEGCWGGAQKGGLNTVVGCEQLGPTAAGSLSRLGAGARRGSVTGPAWGCGQEPCEGFFPQGGGARGGARGAGRGAWPSVSVLPLLAHLLVLPSRAPQEARVGGCCHTLCHAGQGAGLQSAEHVLPGLGLDPMASGDLRRRS